MATHADRPWLTFDCYDTLVSYTESKLSAFSEIVVSKGGDKALADSAWATFEKSEKQLQSGPFLILNKVLKQDLIFLLILV